MKKFILLLLTATMALSFCFAAVNAQDAEPAFIVSDDDEEIYMSNLGEFYEYYQNAVQTSKSDSERWAKLALAEAKFLESGCGTPMYAPFVSYSLTRLVYNTSGYAPWRGTMTHWGEYLITNEIILKRTMMPSRRSGTRPAAPAPIWIPPRNISPTRATPLPIPIAAPSPTSSTPGAFGRCPPAALVLL